MRFVRLGPLLDSDLEPRSCMLSFFIYVTHLSFQLTMDEAAH